jgi:hypothetical protein
MSQGFQAMLNGGFLARAQYILYLVKETRIQALSVVSELPRAFCCHFDAQEMATAASAPSGLSGLSFEQSACIILSVCPKHIRGLAGYTQTQYDRGRGAATIIESGCAASNAAELERKSALQNLQAQFT